MSKHVPLRLGQLAFHMGADYACVMGGRQTTENPIAQLYGESRDIEAYGNLFRAAPDMLAALVRLMEQPSMNPLAMTVDQRKELWAAHEQARAAIAKAEGRS